MNPNPQPHPDDVAAPAARVAELGLWTPQPRTAPATGQPRRAVAGPTLTATGKVLPGSEPHPGRTLSPKAAERRKNRRRAQRAARRAGR